MKSRFLVSNLTLLNIKNLWGSLEKLGRFLRAPKNSICEVNTNWNAISFDTANFSLLNTVIKFIVQASNPIE